MYLLHKLLLPTRTFACDDCATGQPSVCPCFHRALRAARELGEGATITRNGRTLATTTNNRSRDIGGADKANDEAAGIVRARRRRGAMVTAGSGANGLRRAS